MVVVAVAVTGVSIWVLYQAAFDAQRARLVDTAQSQARLIEAVTRFQSENLSGSPKSVLDQVADAHKNYRGFGETGEFTLARREGDMIVFLLGHRHFDLDKPRPVPWNVELAEPMRRALKQLSGTVVGLDYRGVTVLAAYEPVALLNVGIVAKIDMSEIRAPFIKAGLMSFAGALFITLLGVVYFRRVTTPIIEGATAEQALKESEVRFRNLVEGSIQGVIVHRDFKFLFANQAIADILGYAGAEDVLGLDSLLEIFPPEEHALVRSNRDARMRGDKDVPELFELQGVRRDGSLIWLEIRLSVVEWNGEPAIQGTYVEITVRKQAEQALRESEARLRDAIESLPASFLLFDAEDRLVLFNRITLDLMPWHRGILKLGVSYEDILRNAVATGNLAAPPNGREEWIQQRLNQHRNPGAPIEGERRDGQWVSAFERKTSDGGTVSIRLDITERRRAQGALRESEENFRNLIEGSIQGICIIDTERRLLFVNQAYADIFGYASPADVLALKTTAPLTAPHDQGRLIDYRIARLRGEAVPTQYEYDGVRMDGAIVRVQVMSRRVVWRGRDAVQVTLFDVTERRQAEQTLKERELLLRSIIDNAPALLALKGLDGRYLLVNEAFARSRGSSAEAMVGATSYDHANKGHADAATAQDQKVVESGEAVVEERDTVLPDGTPYRALITKFPIFDVEGKLTSFGSFSIDISKLKAAETALRESEMRLRSLIDASPSRITLKDREGKFILVNQAFADDRGTTIEGAVGKTMFDYESKDYADAVAARDRKMLELGAATDGEHASTLPDGSMYHRQLTKFPVRDATGAIVGIGSIGTDITDRKQAERRLAEQSALLRAMLDNIPAIINLKDMEDRYLLTNDAFDKSVGIGKHEAIGKTMREIGLDDAHIESIIAQERRVIETGAVVVLNRVIVNEHGDKTRTATKFPVFDENNAIVSIGSVSIDTTDLRSAEEQLRQSQKMEAVGQLTGGIAHDFNNLLGVIIGNLDILEEQLQGDDSLLELVEAATNSALGGADLNRQLLAFSRTQPLDPRVIDLNAQLSGMLDLLRRTLGETITVEPVCADGLWSCDVDPTQVESALLNLAINARDAMPAGGRLTVETANVMVDDDYMTRQGELISGPYVRLMVSDTGAGMAPADLQRAFEPFFTTKGVGEGSGLGLSMVFGFAKQSGGHATIESREGKGTTVSLYLPRARRPATVDPRTEETPAARGETILVVEDDPDLRKLTVTQLGDLGYDVIEAKDGKIALSVIADTPEVNLLLTDVVLPGGISGPTLAEEIVQRHPSIKTLFMSGYAQDTVDQNSQSAENFLLLQKPFRKTDLARKVRAALVDQSRPF